VERAYGEREKANMKGLAMQRAGAAPGEIGLLIGIVDCGLAETGGRRIALRQSCGNFDPQVP
jgi:hypothetical protein